LLASEGFASVEEVAFVEASEVAAIEGFDEGTAEEIQERARDYLERREAELDAKRRELGVDDDLAGVPGLNSAMLVALGENGVKTVEDFADCATDDLVGWNERKDGTTTRHKGFLEDFDVSKEDAEQMILEARVKAGWIEAPEPQEDEVAAEEPAAEEDAEPTETQAG